MFRKNINILVYFLTMFKDCYKTIILLQKFQLDRNLFSHSRFTARVKKCDAHCTYGENYIPLSYTSLSSGVFTIHLWKKRKEKKVERHKLRQSLHGENL